MSIIRAMCTTVFTFASVHVAVRRSWPDAPKASFATVGEVTSAPYGWMDFCSVNCKNATNPYSRRLNADVTPQAWKTLNEINQQVNAAIMPVSISSIGERSPTTGTIPTTARATARSMRCRSANFFRRKASRARPS